MKFFQSEVVQKELEQMQDLYMDINKMGLILTSPQKREQLDKMLRLIELQQTMFMRVTLSDDPDAKKMKQDIAQSAVMMGLPEGTDMNTVWDNMNKMVQVMKDQIDKQS